jgi:hypothetical protein
VAAVGILVTLEETTMARAMATMPCMTNHVSMLSMHLSLVSMEQPDQVDNLSPQTVSWILICWRGAVACMLKRPVRLGISPLCPVIEETLLRDQNSSLTNAMYPYSVIISQFYL